MSGIFDPWIPISMIAVGSIGAWVGAWLFILLYKKDIRYRIAELSDSAQFSIRMFRFLVTGGVVLLAASTLYFYGGYTEQAVFIHLGEILYLTVGFIGIIVLQILEVELL